MGDKCPLNVGGSTYYTKPCLVVCYVGLLSPSLGLPHFHTYIAYIFHIIELLFVFLFRASVWWCRDTLNKLQNTQKQCQGPWIEEWKVKSKRGCYLVYCRFPGNLAGFRNQPKPVSALVSCLQCARKNWPSWFLKQSKTIFAACVVLICFWAIVLALFPLYRNWFNVQNQWMCVCARVFMLHIPPTTSECMRVLQD